MGNALRHVRGESQKNIVRFIEGLSGKYSRWDIWQDFIIMSATAVLRPQSWLVWRSFPASWSRCRSGSS